MIPRYPRVVVLGAGTMGAQLACLIAGAGSRVTLLDLDAATAQAGLDRAVKLRPSPVYTAGDLSRVRTGGFDELEGEVAGADWCSRRSSSASSRSASCWRGWMRRCPPAVTRRWSPPTPAGCPSRSLPRAGPMRSGGVLRDALLQSAALCRLLELVPHDGSGEDEMFAWPGSPRSCSARASSSRRTPGLHRQPARRARHADDGAPGPRAGPRGRPGRRADRRADRPAEERDLRTLDLVGVDVALAVAEHCHTALTDDPDRDGFSPPQILRDLVERGALGTKTGAGFFRREPDGEILALDLASGATVPGAG